ncbi:hypothetical protein B0E53_04790 [Micromonospora sp. MH33]|nr:hypothetical protein B0E53_04790 [Micromonospora sp. MH33]
MARIASSATFASGTNRRRNTTVPDSPRCTQWSTWTRTPACSPAVTTRNGRPPSSPGVGTNSSGARPRHVNRSDSTRVISPHEGKPSALRYDTRQPPSTHTTDGSTPAAHFDDGTSFTPPRDEPSAGPHVDAAAPPGSDTSPRTAPATPAEGSGSTGGVDVDVVRAATSTWRARADGSRGRSVPSGVRTMYQMSSARASSPARPLAQVPSICMLPVWIWLRAGSYQCSCVVGRTTPAAAVDPATASTRAPGRWSAGSSRVGRPTVNPSPGTASSMSASMSARCCGMYASQAAATASGRPVSTGPAGGVLVGSGQALVSRPSAKARRPAASTGGTAWVTHRWARYPWCRFRFSTRAATAVAKSCRDSISASCRISSREFTSGRPRRAARSSWTRCGSRRTASSRVSGRPVMSSRTTSPPG